MAAFLPAVAADTLATLVDALAGDGVFTAGVELTGGTARIALRRRPGPTPGDGAPAA